MGGYSDWAAWHAAQTKSVEKVSAGKPVSKSAESLSAAPATGSRATKLSYKEQQQLNALPGQIEALEAEQAALMDKVNDPATYASDPGAAQGMANRLAAIDEELLVLLERWEALEAKTGKA